MFKLIAATLAAFYVVLVIFGDESRRVVPDAQVAQASTDNLSLMSLAALSETDLLEVAPAKVSRLSESDAVTAALAAGEVYRSERKRTTLRGVRIAATPVVTDAGEDASTVELWEVTGSRVNLRAGPSSNESVVGQLTRGTEAEVTDEGNGWYRIRTTDGSNDGWIYGDFLSRKS